jgi:dTDP-4-dehydrorhamnose reductase
VILVFGHTGQVASELNNSIGVKTIGRDEADLSVPNSCKKCIQHFQPKAVINAAAYTAVDRAEEEEGLAFVINADAPTVMAQSCAEQKIPFVHISTDYVFNGKGNSAWKPNQPTDPQNAYGRSKLAGELGVRSSGAVHAILRTSWVVSSHGENFVKTMLKLSESQDELSVVSDQIGAPTPARDIALACLKIASDLQTAPEKSGTYHFCGKPFVSWYEFASEIFKLSERNVKLRTIPTSDYPTPAIRPLNSRLDCQSVTDVVGITQPSWHTELKSILEELGVFDER